MAYEFGEHRLDVERRELVRAGQPVHVQPLVFDLLVFLLRHRERVVGKDELLEQVWGGSRVSEAAIASAVRDARAALGDTGGEQRIIRTVRRRGFRWFATVKESTPTRVAGPGQTRESKGLPSERKRCELLIELGERRTAEGAYHQGGRALFLRATSLARSAGWPDLLARAALGVGEPTHDIAVGDAVLVALLEEALAAIGPRNEALRARLLARLAVERRLSRREGADAAASHDALRAARASGDVRALAGAILGHLRQISGPRHLRARRAFATELVEAESACGDVTLEHWGHHFRLCAEIEAGDFTGMDRAAAAFARSAERGAASPHVELLAAFEAGRATWEGRFEAARGLSGQLSELASDSPLTLIGVNAEVLALWRAWLTGEPIPSERLAQLATAPLPDEYAVLAHALAAFLWLETGSRARARDTYESLLEEDVPDNMFALPVFSALGHLAAALGDLRSAERVERHLRPYADRIAVAVGMHYLGSVLHPLGNLARLKGRNDEAVGHLEEARRVEERMQARPFAARVTLDLARAQLAAGRPAEATRELEACLRSARALGMEGLAKRAWAQLARQTTAARSSQVAPRRTSR